MSTLSTSSSAASSPAASEPPDEKSPSAQVGSRTAPLVRLLHQRHVQLRDLLFFAEDVGRESASVIYDSSVADQSEAQQQTGGQAGPTVWSQAWSMYSKAAKAVLDEKTDVTEAERLV